MASEPDQTAAEKARQYAALMREQLVAHPGSDKDALDLLDDVIKNMDAASETKKRTSLLARAISSLTEATGFVVGKLLRKIR